MAAQIKIDSGVVNIAAGFGGLWVSGFNVMTRIDPVTDVIVAQIPTPKTEDFSQVVVGMGSVWVSGDRGLIYRIDPDTNHVIRSIRAPLYAIEAIAVGGGDLWVGGARGSKNAKGSFVRIDPATGHAVGAQIRIDAFPHYAVFIGDWLWVSTYRSILRIDPRAGSVVPVLATHEPGSLAFGAGALWSTASTHGEGVVVRIDPATARVVASISVRRAIGIAFGGGDVWVMTQPPSRSKTLFLPSRKHPGTVVRIDPGTDQIFGSSVRVPGFQPISVAFASGSAWVADYYDSTVSRVEILEQTPQPVSLRTAVLSNVAIPDGLSPMRLAIGEGDLWVLGQKDHAVASVLLRIDQATDQVVASIPLEGEPWYLASGGGSVWVGSPRSGELQRVDVATNQVTAHIQLPGDGVSAITADTQDVWVEVIKNRSDQGQQDLASLVRVDAQSGTVVATIPLEGLSGYDDEVAIGAGAVWVAGVNLTGPNEERGADLVRIDPTTNTIRAVIPVSAFSVRASADEIWVTSPADGTNDSLRKPESWVAYEIDPITNEVSASTPLPKAESAVLAVTDNGVWFSGYDNQGLIHPVRLQGGAFDSSVPPINSAYSDMVFDENSSSIWIAAIIGLERLDLA